MVRAFFYPESVAVVGASSNPQKIGYQILKNILDYGYRGKVFPVNIHEDEILGLHAYRRVSDIPVPVDLVVVAVPAAVVPEVLEDAGKKGVKAVAVISSGFKEVGRADLEERLVEIARKYGFRLLGPNIFGVAYTPNRLNATFGPRDVRPGKIALISQSGALGIALMGWTQTEEIGLSSIVSVGNKADVSDEDLLDFFATDDNTRVIVEYMEAVKDGRAFMDAARRNPKPIIVIKAGRSKRGAQAASSHTGSLAGSDLVYSGAFKQVGIIRAESVRDAFVMARALAELPEPAGDNIVIITNGGGIGVLATDAFEARGLDLYSGPDLVAFKKAMPDFGSFKNPVDITGMADPVMYMDALRIAQEHENMHAIALLYCETAVCDPEELAEGIIRTYNHKKPLVVGMVGGEKTERAIARLNEAGIPAYDSPEDAVRALHALYLWKEGKKKRQMSGSMRSS
ncbi:MAG: acetyl CoA synthetase [Candidatus Diapherotrites archaeon]|nr:acetyl CoA synthetase [Candidatus Diapherotrites archaeon]